jgi:hypothetical protein
MGSRQQLCRVLGLSENASISEIETRMGQQVAAKSHTQQTPTMYPLGNTQQWSAPQLATTLTEDQRELLELFKSVTLSEPAGKSRAEIDKLEQSFAKYPALAEAYRLANLQSG